MSALDELQAVMFNWKDQASVIKLLLDCRGTGRGSRRWRVQLVEEIDDSACKLATFLKWEDCVTWAYDKLKDQPNCKRIACDIWDFKHRRDAEKFITLFHLSWAQ